MISGPLLSGPGGRCSSESLLRNALRGRRAKNGAESIALLAAVSRGIMSLLVAELKKPDHSPEFSDQITRLIGRERRSLRQLQRLRSAIRFRES